MKIDLEVGGCSCTELELVVSYFQVFFIIKHASHGEMPLLARCHLGMFTRQQRWAQVRTGASG